VLPGFGEGFQDESLKEFFLQFNTQQMGSKRIFRSLENMLPSENGKTFARDICRNGKKRARLFSRQKMPDPKHIRMEDYFE